MVNIMVKFIPATGVVSALFLAVAKKSACWVYSMITV